MTTEESKNTVGIILQPTRGGELNETALMNFYRSMCSLIAAAGPSHTWIFRPHPKQSVAEVKQILSHFIGVDKHIQVLGNSDLSFVQFLGRCHAFFGLSSAALIDAHSLGKKVYSLASENMAKNATISDYPIEFVQTKQKNWQQDILSKL